MGASNSGYGEVAVMGTVNWRQRVGFPSSSVTYPWLGSLLKTTKGPSSSLHQSSSRVAGVCPWPAAVFPQAWDLGEQREGLSAVWDLVLSPLN